MKRACLAIASFFAFSCVFAVDAQAADDATNRCVDAHHASQTDRRDGHLVKARSELVTCAQDACPALIASDCKRWLGEVGDRIPTIVVVVPDAGALSTLTLDGRPLDPSVLGRAIEVDPGPHALHAETGDRSGETDVAAIEGVHDTNVVVVLHDRRAVEPPPATRPDRRSIAPLVVGGIGIVGLGVASGFGIVGLAERSHLESEGCAPNCAHDDVTTVRRNFAIADVTLGVSIVAIATAVVLYVVDTPKERADGRAPFTFRF